MDRLLRRALLSTVFAWLCLLAATASAETGILVLHVDDVHDHPVVGVKIGVKGDGGKGISDKDGKIRIQLAPQTQPKEWVTLQVLDSPPGKELVLVSPWDSRVLIPSFENKSDDFVEVVVVQSGDLEALKSGAVLAALTAQINKANAPKSLGNEPVKENPKANLQAVAKQYGLTSDELDKAIRAWGATTTDPYQAGLAALYARKYDAATSSLQDSLKLREGRLAADQKAIAADQQAVADAACFLGQSLSEQTRYRESVTAYQRCLGIRPNDPKVLNDMAFSQFQTADYNAAESLFRQALAIDEKALGPDNPSVATNANNIGEILMVKGDLGGALTYTRRALEIDEKVYGPEHPTVARDANNIGAILYHKEELDGALTYTQRALQIGEKVYGPEHSEVATYANNIGQILQAKGDLDGALTYTQRALQINEKVYGRVHPAVATDANNIGQILKAKGDLDGALTYTRQALQIDEKVYGPEHPAVATDANNIGTILKEKGDLNGALTYTLRALQIDEKVYGPEHPTVGMRAGTIGAILYGKGDLQGALTYTQRALTIFQKVYGPDNPNTKAISRNLEAIKQAMKH